DPTYQNRLSPASRCSLELQGESFDSATARDFVRQPYAGDAVRLRRWDDMAKVSNLDVPRLDHYRRLVEGLATYRQAPNRAAVGPNRSCAARSSSSSARAAPVRTR